MRKTLFGFYRFDTPLKKAQNERFVLSNMGNGLAYTLTELSTGLSVHWQGDDALEISDRLDAGGLNDATLGAIWADYEELAQ